MSGCRSLARLSCARVHRPKGGRSPSVGPTEATRPHGAATRQHQERLGAMTINIALQSEGLAGRFEELAGHSRLRRVGNHVLIAGTAAIQPNGTLYCPYDGHEQALFILHRFEKLLREAGASLEDTVRIRAYFASPEVVTE